MYAVPMEQNSVPSPGLEGNKVYFYSTFETSIDLL